MKKICREGAANVPFSVFLPNVVKRAEAGTVNMMKIVLCEDDLQYQSEFRNMLSHVLFSGEDIIIECYADGSELIQAVESDTLFYADLIFMDIQMPKLDGMRTAEILREKQIRSDIIFVTAHEEYVFQGYQVHAWDYLLKPVSHQKLKDVMTRYRQEQQWKENHHLLVHRRLGGEKILLSQVQYFVSERRKIRAVLDVPHASVEFYMKMDELEHQLQQKNFLRCHQSFIVNAGKIQQWDGSGICLSGGERIPVSKRYRKDVIALTDEAVNQNV